MAEGTYEYECMRAELLGIERPNFEEFTRKKAEQMKLVEGEAVDTENLQAAEHQQEELKNVTGKLDELNSILSVTQKKINNFKYRCSSVTSYVKNRLGSVSSKDVAATKIENGDSAEPKQKTNEEIPKQTLDVELQRKSDLTSALDKHVDKLDSLLDKSEDAHYKMTVQRKQMQRFLK